MTACAMVPSKQRDGEVACVWAFWAPHVHLSLVPDEDVFGAQQYGPAGVCNNQLPCRGETEGEDRVGGGGNKGEGDGGGERNGEITRETARVRA